MSAARSILMSALLAPLLVLGGCDRAPERTFQGWVEADFIFVAPDEAGRVQKLAVREGDRVEVGAPLFTLESELQDADVAANEGAVAEARARLKRVEAEQQRPEEIAVLEAQQRRAEAMLKLSTAERDRQRQLAEKNISSKAQLDTAEANYSRDVAALEEIRRQIRVGHLSAREDDIAAARWTLEAAKARLESAKTRLARRSIASPVAGSVQRVYFRQGEMVPAGRPVLALLPPGNIKLRFFVSETRLPDIAPDSTVQVTCDGCDGEIAARVSFISPTAEYTPPVVYTPTERAKLVFLVEARPVRPELLRVGQPVRVTIAPREAKSREAKQ